MAVRAEPEHLEVDAARALKRPIVACELRVEVVSVAVEKVHAIRPAAKPAEEMLLHERAVAARRILADPDELIQIERRHARETDATRALPGDQAVVETQRCAAGREAEHEGGIQADRGGDLTDSNIGDVIGSRQHAELHWSSSR